MSEKKIGISGGTFDPIHCGHLVCADFVRHQLDLDAMVFLPAGQPPHKLDRRITSGKDRLEMVQLAIRDYPDFYASSLEIDRKGETYTVDTLEALHDLAGQRLDPSDTVVFYYLLGADALGNLLKWRRYRDVFALCEFVALMRPGYTLSSFAEDRRLAEAEGAVIHVLEGPLLPVSSTEIRRRIRCGESVGELLPPMVEQYIRKKKLYLQSDTLNTQEEWMRDLQERLSPKRYRHCVQVMEESGRLAERFGADREKCRIAGLLHDCARELSPEQYSWLGVCVPPDGQDAFDGYNGNLYHGRAGRILAERRYGIRDREILDAIGEHVTGRPGMSLVSSLVFLADYTEPGRVGEPFDTIRGKLADGLYPALQAACDATIRWVLQKNGPLGVETVRTRNDVLRKGNQNRGGT